MNPEYRPLVMRANRLMGAALVEHNLVKIEDLERANERLLEIVNGGELRETTVLGVLAYELKVVREDDVLAFIVDSEGIGLADLRCYEVNEELRKSLDPQACWATWSVPFDKEEDYVFIATAYYISPAVRNYWESQFKSPILWFGTTLENVSTILEKIEAERGEVA